MGVSGEASAPMVNICLDLAGSLFHLTFSGDYESEVRRTGLCTPQTITEIEGVINPRTPAGFFSIRVPMEERRMAIWRKMTAVLKACSISLN